MTASDSPNRAAAASPMAPPAAMRHSVDAASPSRPLAAPTAAATAIIGPTRSVHSRAVSAGTVSRATDSSVPMAGMVVAIVTVTAASTSTSSRRTG